MTLCVRPTEAYWREKRAGPPSRNRFDGKGTLAGAGNDTDGKTGPPFVDSDRPRASSLYERKPRRTLKTISTIMRKRTYTILTCFLIGAHGMLGGELKLLPFQGHLTDASGETIPDGVPVVQFKIYDAPVAGTAVWPGEVHMLSVNDGLVNTVLGSKSSMDFVDFGRTLYLELTVDANGDGRITEADSPLLPRQIILPSIFAVEASKMIYQNADERVAAGWEVLFGGQNPTTGLIPGSKLAEASVPLNRLSEKIGAQSLAEGASLANIQNGSIPGAKLETGAVGSDKISTGAVNEDHLADGSVTLRKMAPIDPGPKASAGQMAMSEVEPGFSFSSATYVPIEKLAIEIQTTGRPVEIFLVPDVNATPATGTWNMAGVNSSSVIGLFMDDELVAEQGSWIVSNASSVVRLGVPPSSVRFVRVPSAGFHRFDIRVRAVGGSSTLSGVQLLAIER